MRQNSLEFLTGWPRLVPGALGSLAPHAPAVQRWGQPGTMSERQAQGKELRLVRFLADEVAALVIDNGSCVLSFSPVEVGADPPASLVPSSKSNPGK